MSICEGCGREYELHLMVQKVIWDEIKPSPEEKKGGLLCGACILNRTEALREYRSCGMQILIDNNGVYEGGVG